MLVLLSADHQMGWIYEVPLLQRTSYKTKAKGQCLSGVWQH